MEKAEVYFLSELNEDQSQLFSKIFTGMSKLDSELPTILRLLKSDAKNIYTDLHEIFITRYSPILFNQMHISIVSLDESRHTLNLLLSCFHIGLPNYCLQLYGLILATRVNIRKLQSSIYGYDS